MSNIGADIRRALRAGGVDVRSDMVPPRVLAARDSFSAFCGYLTRDGYHLAAHLAYIHAALNEVLLYMQTGGTQGLGALIIEAPPRHGKSLTVARLFAAYVLGKLPNTQIILASHGQDLSTEHGVWVRNRLIGQRFGRVFPGVMVNPNDSRKEAWSLAEPYSGSYRAVGKGSSVVGRGANLILVDDLVKDRSEAESQHQRDTDYNWFQDDLMTRAEPHAAFVGIGTRYHMDDVIGRELESDEAHYRVIKLPAIAEDDDLLGREPGEALWPERWPLAVLERRREKMTEYSFSALYQQHPIPLAGGLFKRDDLPLVNHIPDNLETVCRFWDLAMSSKSTADFTVGVLMGKTTDGRYIILDVQRFRKEWGEVVPSIIEVAPQDTRDVAIGVEEVAYMSRAVQQLLTAPGLHGYSIQGVKPDKDKVTRAMPLADRAAGGLVSVLRRSWSAAFIDELVTFPGGKHDDQVDAAAGAYAMCDEVFTMALAMAGDINYAPVQRFSDGDY